MDAKLFVIVFLFTLITASSQVESTCTKTKDCKVGECCLRNKPGGDVKSCKPESKKGGFCHPFTPAKNGVYEYGCPCEVGSNCVLNSSDKLFYECK